MTLIFLASCSTAKEKKKLADKIQAEEVRSSQEIKSHAEVLLDNHPDLDTKTKDKLRSLLHTTMNKQQDLKDQESRILQLLLKKSFRVGQLSNQELKEKNNLMVQLSDLYKHKSRNILGLIKNIVQLSQQDTIKEEFRNDLIIFMRDFR